MKVVFVDAGTEWRGGQTQMLLLATHGPRPHAVLVRPDAPIRPALERAGLPVVPVPMVSRWRRAPLREALRAVDPDLVAAHDGHGAALALAAASVPVVVHRRVDFAPSRAGYRRYRRAAKVIAVSGAVRDVLARGGVVAEVVHDGVDPARFSAGPDPGLPRSVGIPDGAPWALAVGALVTHKGHQHLIDAVARLPGWYAVVLGDGPQRAALVAYSRARGVADRIAWPGHRDDVPAWLATAHRFVHPSVEEGLGQAVIEAAFAGAPIVTTTAGGLAELGLGRTCRPADPGALAAALLADPVRADRARLERFTAAAMCASTWAIYRDAVIDRPRGAR